MFSPSFPRRLFRRGELQFITYHEYLPALLGPDALAPYQGYRADVHGAVSNVFATAAYRYGHSALSGRLLRLDAAGNEVDAGHLALRDALFAPRRLIDEGGIEPILRGLAAQVCQAIDPYVVDDVRNFLFGEPGAGGFDLVSLNIQRGRDHGLPGYNDVREAFGLRRAVRFKDITSDRALARRLAAAYQTLEKVDLWVGGLAEDKLPGAMVGRLVFLILEEQFEALRDGDCFWYQNVLNAEELALVEASRLGNIVRCNTGIGAELAADVFHVGGARRPRSPRRRP